LPGYIFLGSEQPTGMKFCTVNIPVLDLSFCRLEMISSGASKCLAAKGLRQTIFGHSRSNFTHLTVIISKAVYQSISCQPGLNICMTGAFQKRQGQAVAQLAPP